MSSGTTGGSVRPWIAWIHRAPVTVLQTSALEPPGLPHGQVWVTGTDDVVHSVAGWMDSAAAGPASFQPRDDELRDRKGR